MTTVAEAFVTLRPDLSKFRKETEAGMLSLGGIAKAAAIGIAAAGAAITGIAVLSIKAAIDEQAGIERLAQAVRSNGGDWDKLGATIEGQIAKWERLTAFSDGDMRDALSTLTALTGSATDAMDRLPIAMDFARGAGIDLATTSRLLGKVTDETTTVLARYGIRVEKGADATDVLAKVQQKFAGQSATFAKTAAGQWQIFTNQLQNLREDLGFALLPTFTRFAQVAVAAVDAARKKFQEIKPAVDQVVASVSSAIKTMWDSAPVRFFVGTVFTELQKIPGFIATVAGALGEMFEILSGRGRPSAGGVLRTLVGDKVAEGIQTSLKSIRVIFTDAFDFMKPIIQSVIDKVIELKGEFDKLPEGLKKLVGVVVVTDVAVQGFSTVMLLALAPFVALFANMLKIVDSQLLVKFAKGLGGITLALLGNIGALAIWDPLIAVVFTALSLPLIPLALLVAAIAAIGVALFLLVTHWDDVSTSARLLAQIISTVVGRAFSALGTAVSNFFAPFGKLLDLFRKDAPFALGLLFGAIVGTFSAIQGAVGNAITFVFDTFGNFLNVLGGWKTDLGNLIGTAFQGVLDTLGEFAGKAIPTIVRFVIDAAAEFFKLKDQFAQAAADAVGGFIVGFVEAIPNAIASIVQAAKDFIGGWNTAMGNKSPSTVFAESGRNITRGLVKGIKEGMPAVNNAFAGLSSGLTGPSVLTAGIGGGGGSSITISPTVHLNYAGPADAPAAAQLASDVLDIITGDLRQQMRRMT